MISDYHTHCRYNMRITPDKSPRSFKFPSNQTKFMKFKHATQCNSRSRSISRITSQISRRFLHTYMKRAGERESVCTGYKTGRLASASGSHCRREEWWCEKRRRLRCRQREDRHYRPLGIDLGRTRGWTPRLIRWLILG